MHHHGRVHSLERSSLEQKNLAAGVADFFRGRAYHSHRQPHFVGHVRESNSRTDRHRRN
jgi:hypothetical protein